MYPPYYYVFYDPMGNSKHGTVSINTGNRAPTGADVETFARTQERNYTDQIYVPIFEYWAKPVETIRREKQVSASLWCDVDDSATNYPNQTGHPFPSRDTKRRNMSFTDFNEDGSPNVIQGDMCGYHAARNPFFNPNAAKEIAAQSKAEEAKAKGYDPEYVEWLEKRNGVGTENDHSA